MRSWLLPQDGEGTAYGARLARGREMPSALDLRLGRWLNHRGRCTRALVCALACCCPACGAVNAQPRPPKPARVTEPASRDAFLALAAAVRAMAAEPHGPRGELIVDALQQFANVIDVLSHRLSLSPDSLRKIGDPVGSEPRGISKADVIAGLETTLGYLLTRALPSSRKLEYERAANALAAELEAMDANASGAGGRWWAHALSAFRAAADLSFMAAGHAPPFQGTWQKARTETPDVCETIVQARAVVLELGRTQWPYARTATARALDALANVVEAVSIERRHVSEISGIEFQAERLQRTSSLAFGAGSWVKRALTATLDVFEKLWRREELMSWMTAARAAVEGLDEGRSLSFQRAAVQDAFRTTISVFQAAIELEHTCASQALH